MDEEKILISCTQRSFPPYSTPSPSSPPSLPRADTPCPFISMEPASDLLCWDGTLIPYVPFSTSCDSHGSRAACPSSSPMCALFAAPMWNLNDFACDAIGLGCLVTGSVSLRSCRKLFFVLSVLLCVCMCVLEIHHPFSVTHSSHLICSSSLQWPRHHYQRNNSDVDDWRQLPSVVRLCVVHYCWLWCRHAAVYNLQGPLSRRYAYGFVNWGECAKG